METKIETTIVYWGYIGIMENKMEAAILRLSSKLDVNLGTLICLCGVLCYNWAKYLGCFIQPLLYMFYTCSIIGTSRIT